MKISFLLITNLYVMDDYVEQAVRAIEGYMSSQESLQATNSLTVKNIDIAEPQVLFSQLQVTKSVLVNLTKPQRELHKPLHRKVYYAVEKAGTLVKNWCETGKDSDAIVPTEKREHLLDILLTIRWWTWVTALQEGERCTRDANAYGTTCPLEFGGVSRFLLESDSAATPRTLPSYAFEVWQQETHGTLQEILKWTSEGSKQDDEKHEQSDMVLSFVKAADMPTFTVLGMSSAPILRNDSKPVAIGYELTIDLTQDLLGVSHRGWVVRTSLGQEPCVLKRINSEECEALDLAQLWHPHIVHFIHYWREPPTQYLFLVMELMDGDLARYIKQSPKPPFSMPVAIDVMLQIVKGMLYLHEMDITHPLLKSSNILFKQGKNREEFEKEKFLIKLGGFGSPKRRDSRESDALKKRDVERFGLICLELLTGEVQFEEDSWEIDVHIKPEVPDTTLPILKHCITQCLAAQLSFSEILVILLLAECQILQSSLDDTYSSSQGIVDNKGHKPFKEHAQG